MTGLLVIIRIGLAAVLALAGVAKLVDLAGTRDALRGFGVPGRLCGPAAVGLPLVELAIAVGLLAAASARWAAIAAVALLAAFSVVVARALWRGEHPDCHCFGQFSQGPAGISVLVRNAILVVAGVFVALAPHAPGPGVAAWIAHRSAAGLVAFWLGLALVVITATAAWFGRELLRQQGRLMLRIDALEDARSARYGLPVGAPAPRFALDGFRGDEVDLDRLLARRLPVLLVFSNAHCGPCIEAVPSIARAQREWDGRLTIAVLSDGSTPQSEAAWSEHDLRNVGIAPTRAVNLSYGAAGTPAAVIVSRDGLIGSEIAAGLARVEELLADPVGHGAGAMAAPDLTDRDALTVTHSAGGE